MGNNLTLDRNSDDYEKLFKVVVGEAVGEVKIGQIAVAWAVKNRVDDPVRWGNTIADVIDEPGEFRCLDRDNIKKLGVNLASPEAQAIHEWLPTVYDDHPDPTFGATHYYPFKGKHFESLIRFYREKSK